MATILLLVLRVMIIQQAILLVVFMYINEMEKIGVVK